MTDEQFEALLRMLEAMRMEMRAQTMTLSKDLKSREQQEEADQMADKAISVLFAGNATQSGSMKPQQNGNEHTESASVAERSGWGGKREGASRPRKHGDGAKRQRVYRMRKNGN